MGKAGAVAFRACLGHVLWDGLLFLTPQAILEVELTAGTASVDSIAMVGP